MEKMRLRWKALSFTAAIALTVTGCGGSAKGTEMYEMATADTAAVAGEVYDNGAGYDGSYLSDGVEAPAEEAMAEEEGAATGPGAPQVQDVSRKLIKNVDLEVETETFPELLSSVEARAAALGGYIEQSYTYNGSSYYGNENRNANLTVRIPGEKLEEFLSSVSEYSNVVSRNDSVKDVTLQYVDMESHKKALMSEQERLLELLGQAETVEEIIGIESRLSEVRYQIESMESQLRTLDNQVSYSTVCLNIREVAKYTPVKEQSPWEKISTGFANSLYDVANGLVDFGIGFIINLPYIFLWAAIILIAVLILSLILKRRKKKGHKRPGKGEGQRGLFRRRATSGQSADGPLGQQGPESLKPQDIAPTSQETKE